MTIISISPTPNQQFQKFIIVDAGRFAILAEIFSKFATAPEISVLGPARDAAARVVAMADDGPDHTRVCAMVEVLKAFSTLPSTAQTRLFVAKCVEYGGYLDAKANEGGVNPHASWPSEGLKGDGVDAVGVVVDEIAQHMQFFATPQYRYQAMATQTEEAVAMTLPRGIIDMWQAVHLPLVYPFFEKSLGIAGDACEFGCFRGTLSVKLAWFLKAAELDKRYYAFDTFHGFEINDPGGGALGVGAFRDDEFNAFDYLTKWAKVLPLTPVKGDATQTVKTLTKPLSFVWMDLDMGVLMDPVLRQIWHLCGPDTIIGFDDVGRPETPTVQPWFDELHASGAFELLFNSDDIAPNTFIRFVRKANELPPAKGAQS